MRAHLWCLGIALAAGCGGGEEARLSLRFLYEANPDDRQAPLHAWEGYGCGEDAPEGGECVAVRLSACNQETGACSFVLDGPAEGQDDTIASLQGGTFDLKTKTANRTDLFLQMGLYSGEGLLLATGESKGVSFVEGHPVGVPLVPVGNRTACPEPLGAATTGLSRRAFHTATLLPNDEVLIVGGLSGPIVNVTPNGNALEESIDVLRPHEGVARRVTSVDNQTVEEAGQQLYRAFHQAAYLRTEEDGRYRVRVFGGIRAFGTQPVAIVSLARGDTPLQLLISSAAGEEPAPPVDLLYDVESRTVTVVEVSQDSELVPRASFGGFAALTDELGSDTMPGGADGGFYVGGGLGSWRATQYTVSQVDPVLDTFLTNQNGGTANPSPPPLRVGRVGTTAIGIGTTGVLFWGGNVWSTEDFPGDPEAADAALAEEIGELHDPRGTETPSLVTLSGLAVQATAFHTATVAAIDGDGTRRIVVAGGYVLSHLGVTTEFSPVPLYLLSFDPEGNTAVASEVDCQDRNDQPADCAEVFGGIAFATSTWVSPGRVLIVGGNFRYTYGEGGQARTTLHGARAVAGIVTVTGNTAVFEPVDLAEARYGHTSTRLSDGSVLILGGMTLACNRVDETGECSGFGDLVPLATYEIFNPGLAFSPNGSCDAAL